MDVEVVNRQALSIDDFTLYPLFTAELIELMRTLIAPEQQSSVATAVVVRAQRAP